MVDGEGRGVRRVGEVAVKGPQRGGLEHALVGDGAGGEGADVAVGQAGRPGGGLHQLAQQEQLPLQGFAGRALDGRHHHLPDAGLGGGGQAADDGRVDGHLAPPDDAAPPFRGHDLFQQGLGGGLARVVGRQEQHAQPGAGRVHATERRVGPEEGPGDGRHDARPVATHIIRGAGAPMLHAAQGGQGLGQDGVGGLILEGRDEADLKQEEEEGRGGRRREERGMRGWRSWGERGGGRCGERLSDGRRSVPSPRRPPAQCPTHSPASATKGEPPHHPSTHAARVPLRQDVLQVGRLDWGRHVRRGRPRGGAAPAEQVGRGGRGRHGHRIHGRPPPRQGTDGQAGRPGGGEPGRGRGGLCGRRGGKKGRGLRIDRARVYSRWPRLALSPFPLSQINSPGGARRPPGRQSRAWLGGLPGGWCARRGECGGKGTRGGRWACRGEV